MKNKISILLSLIILPFLTQACSWNGEDVQIMEGEDEVIAEEVKTEDKTIGETNNQNSAQAENAPQANPSATPPEPAQVSFSIQGVNVGLNYANLSFALKNVQSAFLVAPISNTYLTNPIYGSQFKGNIQHPFAGPSVNSITRLLNMDYLYEFNAQAYDSVNHSMMPLNYCLIPKQAKWNAVTADSRCFQNDTNSVSSNGYNFLGYNYVSIFVPLKEGRAHGAWNLRAHGSKNVFTIFYRDWAGQTHRKIVSESH